MIIIKEARDKYFSTLERVTTTGTFTCPECQKTHRMQIEAICTVEHIVYVPIYAHQKKVIVRCPVCDTMFAPAYFPTASREVISRLEKKSYRWYHFLLSGFTILFVLIFVIGMWIGNRQENDYKRDQIAILETGDVVFYELENGDRSAMYVTEVAGDTLYVRQNRKSVQKGDVFLIDEPMYYTEKVTLFSRTKLEELFAEDKVYKIYKSTTTIEFNPEIFENIDQ
ncbi:hypothetical protein NWE55_08755 [Myroides albus]|uniref:Zinc-ribbon 15 domain-containing protein n=1 Tax=Myroides albus TaxID=2562892 RepID=A0A6I3LMC9_9FLAO|nr:hypothetical protein [Myroides albus]MTG98480.1 hypothetical protein [Myroides albus]UVD78237.1 hypothetical protein NWE55_08755 [Myroides albus]